MDGAGFWLLFFVPWAATGLGAAAYMARHGHFWPAWAALGLAFGPLILPLALEARRHERTAMARVLATGRPAGGPIDVLVGIDGSEASHGALHHAVSLVGRRMGRLTLAMVVDFDTGGPGERPELAMATQLALARAEELGAEEHVRPDVVLLAGMPAEALLRYAREHGFELLVVGAHGHGRAIGLGSVAATLARHADLPVLIGPPLAVAFEQPAPDLEDPANLFL